MTFASAAWAIDGAIVGSALARLSSYAESGGVEGVVSIGDLTVTPLDVPGPGLQISPGGALLLNRYQSPKINQTYTVLNSGAQILDSTSMPPVATSRSYHLVVITVGDPEFPQAGHPWMTSNDPVAGTETTFQYVRPYILRNVPSGAIASPTAAARYIRDNIAYPAVALAGLDIPANTATITSSQIIDLRKVARPRNTEEMFTAAGSSSNPLNGAGGVAGQYENWPNTATFSVDIPDWATVAKVQAFVESATLSKAGSGALRVTIVGAGSTPATNLNESTPANGVDRIGYNIGGKITIPAAVRGTTVQVRIEGMPKTDASKGFLSTDASTGALIRVRFEESAA